VRALGLTPKRFLSNQGTMFSTHHSREGACEEFETEVPDYGGASFDTRPLGAPQDNASILI
jgi:hypothetical protein